MRNRLNLFLVFCLAVSGTFFFSFVRSDGSSGHQNPMLRDHFLRQCLEITYRVPAFSTSEVYERVYDRVNRGGVERHVDRFLDEYLRELSQKLGEVRTRFSQAQRSQEQALAETANPTRRHESHKRWAAALKIVADHAKDLRNMLALVLTGLEDKSNFKPRIESDLSHSGFKDEMRFIEEQITKAERRIVDYYFRPTHIVHVSDLQNENMMIYLYRAWKMSKELGKKVASG